MNYGAKVLQAASPLPISPSSALVGSWFLLARVVSAEAVSSFSRVPHECLFRRWKWGMSSLEIPAGRRRAASEMGFPVSGCLTAQNPGWWMLHPPAGLDGEF